jgi:peroxiredoxin
VNHVSETAARSLVRDLDGGEHELRELWAERPAVLVFVRHFGCLFCREQAEQLRAQVDRIHERGAELVVIGNGNRHFARGFREQLGLATPLYVDTTRVSYRALGMRRSLRRTLLSPAAWRSGWRALRAGFRQRRTQGDPWQLGGVLVVTPDGRVPYAHLSETAGDHPPVADVLAAIPSR